MADASGFPRRWNTRERLLAEASLTNRMQQTTVSLVFLDSYGCGPAPRIHLGTEHPGLRSIPFAVDSVKQEFGRGDRLLDFAMVLE